MGLLDRQYEVRRILGRVFFKVPSDVMSHRDRARVEEFFQDVTEDNKKLRKKVKKLKSELERIRDRYEGQDGFLSGSEASPQQKGSEAQGPH